MEVQPVEREELRETIEPWRKEGSWELVVVVRRGGAREVEGGGGEERRGT